MMITIDLIIFYVLGLCVFLIFIPYLKRLSGLQWEKEYGLTSHLPKAGTPTMGGIIIYLLSFIFMMMLMWTYKDHLNNLIPFIIIIICTSCFMIIGLIDDLLIVLKHHNNGLKPLYKLLMMLISCIICYCLIYLVFGKEKINFFGLPINLYFGYGIFLMFLLLGATNATNLTDGIDGLLGSLSVVTYLSFLRIAILKEDYLISLYISGCLCGVISFLTFNLHQAKLFMGNVGSIYLGSSFVIISILLDCEIYLFFFCFVYILEALSVIFQVWFYKRTKGRRIFKMSPLHHHFELCDFNEYEICLLFVLIQVVMSLFGLYLYQVISL